jgi:hypothetical protein
MHIISRMKKRAAALAFSALGRNTFESRVSICIANEKILFWIRDTQRTMTILSTRNR